jgi:hypothetical protein
MRAHGDPFGDRPLGGRPAALGSAYTALADDAYAPLWNPGGLGAAQGGKVALGQLREEAGTSEFLSFSQKATKRLGLGASAVFSRGSKTAGAGAAAGWSFGQLSLGAGARFLEGGRALDLGAHYRFDPAWTAGAFLSAGEARIGTAFIPVKGLTTALEAARSSGRLGLRAGAEWTFLSLGALRAGLDTMRRAGNDPGWSVGAGLSFLDYAFSPAGHSLAATFRFGAAPRTEEPEVQAGKVPDADERMIWFR